MNLADFLMTSVYTELYRTEGGSFFIAILPLNRDRTRARVRRITRERSKRLGRAFLQVAAKRQVCRTIADIMRRAGGAVVCDARGMVLYWRNSHYPYQRRWKQINRNRGLRLMQAWGRL